MVHFSFSLLIVPIHYPCSFSFLYLQGVILVDYVFCQSSLWNVQNIFTYFGDILMLMPVFKRWHWHIFYIHRCRPCSSFKQCFDFDQSIDTKITNGLYFWKILKNLVCIWSVFWEKVVCIWSVVQTFFSTDQLYHHCISHPCTIYG